MMTQYAYFYSIELSNAAVATVIQYTAPVLILVIICLKERRAPRLLEILALLCAMLGVFFLATHAQISALVISPKALFWCLVSTVCVCVLQPSSRKAKRQIFSRAHAWLGHGDRWSGALPLYESLGARRA